MGLVIRRLIARKQHVPSMRDNRRLPLFPILAINPAYFWPIIPAVLEVVMGYYYQDQPI
jgi:hypothetical protein